jgi:S-phase kinase-associated protein 1
LFLFQLAKLKMADLTAAADEVRTVHLVSQEGESYDVPMSFAKLSQLVKTMIDDDQDDEEAQEIPLPNVKSAILAKIVEFCHHYHAEPMNEIEKVINLR